MDIFSSFYSGLLVVLQPHNLMYCFIGVSIGTFIGVLPGIGSMAAIAMILPLTFYLEPTSALLMIAGVYYGAEYGGSIASILMNIPGTPAASITAIEGYPMAQNGRAEVALFSTAIALLSVRQTMPSWCMIPGMDQILIFTGMISFHGGRAMPLGIVTNG